MSKRILLTSGIHGDERSGPYILMDFMRHDDHCFVLNHRSYPNLYIDTIPIINPIGVAKGYRVNGDFVDLNRTFHDDECARDPHETQIVKKELCVRGEYDLLVSFHEEPDSEEFYLYDSGCGENSRLVKTVLDMASNYVPLLTEKNFDDFGNDVRAGYCQIKKGDKSPTFEEWAWRNHIAKRVLTIEIPGKIHLNQKISIGRDILTIILMIENEE